MIRWPYSCGAAPDPTPVGRSRGLSRAAHRAVPASARPWWVLTAHVGAEGDRARAGALAEELAEVRGAREAQLGGDLRGGPVAVRQQSPGLEDHPAVDEVLRADAGRGHRRPGEGARRVPEYPG